MQSIRFFNQGGDMVAAYAQHNFFFTGGMIGFGRIRGVTGPPDLLHVTPIH